MSTAEAVDDLTLAEFKNVEDFFEGMCGKIVIITATIRPFFDQGFLVAEGEALAIPKISELVNAMYPGQLLEPILSAFLQFRPDQNVARNVFLRDCNMILLGGPASNDCSAKVLAMEDLQQHTKCAFEHAELRVPGLDPPSTAYTEVTVNGTSFEYLSEDRGWGVRCKSPFNSERRIYLFAGVETFGTCGAAAAALTIPLIGERWKDEGKPEVFEYAVEVRRVVRPFGKVGWRVRYPNTSDWKWNPEAWEQFYHLLHALGRARGNYVPMPAGMGMSAVRAAVETSQPSLPTASVCTVMSLLVAVLSGSLLLSGTASDLWWVLKEVLTYILIAGAGLFAVGIACLLQDSGSSNSTR